MSLFHVYDHAQATVPIVTLSQAQWQDYEKDTRLKQILKVYPFSGNGLEILLQLNEAGQLERVFAGTSFTYDDPRNWIMLFAKLQETLPEGMHFHAETLKEKYEYEAMTGWALATYRFDEFKKEPQTRGVSTLHISTEEAAKKIEQTMDSLFLCKNLINTPANHLIPTDLVQIVKDLAEEHSAEMKSYVGADLLLENLPTVYAVGKGSANPPAFIDLHWGNPNHPGLTLIGKGVVFDTGGQNLKGPAGMRNMKKDMGGAAVAVSLAKLIMTRKLPVHLRLLIPTVENSPGWRAYRPGDIIKTRKGLQVEVGNTDAEGRLILCDALALAAEEEQDLIMDFATLTGAARVALGEDLPACYSPDSGLIQELSHASQGVSDPLWPMPLWEPYTRFLKSDVADFDNMASTPLAGSVTAALFLWQFVKPRRNWIHFDVFGWRNTALPGYPKGGEASAVRAVFEFLEKRYS